MDPNLKTLWSHFALVKEKLFRNSTSYLFRSGVHFSCYNIKQGNQQPHIKYIMKLSKLKHLQRYMTTFELGYINFECLSQSQKLYTTFTSKIEEVFETLETSDIDIKSPHSMIEPIVNHNFLNTFQHHNGKNQHQQTHNNTSKRYQPRSYKRPRTSSIPYLKDCIRCGINNKCVRELLM